MNKLKSKKRGFTLIESLLAIGVLIVGILSAFILVIRSLSNVPLIQSRLIAANLAQEGIELVRQKRDSNYLKGISWAVGFNIGCVCKDGLELDDDCSFQLDTEDRVLKPYDRDDYLKLNPDTGKYGYGAGEMGPYYLKRRIEICFPEQNYALMNSKEMRVKIFMNWKVKRNSFELVVEDHLFNYFNR